MSDNHPTTTNVSSVTIVLGDNHHARTITSRYSRRGSLFIGETHTGGIAQIDGTPAQLRSLAVALFESADELEAVEDERTDRDMAAQA